MNKTLANNLRRAMVLIAWFPRYVALRLLFPRGLKPTQIKRYLWGILPVRTSAQHQDVTLVMSVDRPIEISRRLFTVATSSAEHAMLNHLPFLDERLRRKVNCPEISTWLKSGKSLNFWPGEHYRLLAGIASVLKARTIIEIGTFLGVGALALKHGASEANGCVTTFDIVKWNSFPASALEPADFDERLVQIVEDLTNPAVFAKHQALFEQADLIFMDADKDGCMERAFLESFSRCKFKRAPILIVDDIYLWNMLDIWESINLPKLDISCFGHYTGTGIVELSSDAK